MYGYVYKTTNLLTNKIYIGQHKSSKYDSTYYGSGRIITALLKKYDKSNFNNEVLCECFSEQELNEKEIYYIDLFNSRNPEIGYNIASGGAFGDSGYHQGMKGKHQTTKQKEAASKANSYVRNDEIRKNFSDVRKLSWKNKEYVEKQLKSRKGRVAPNKGLKCSEEQKQKISNTVHNTLVNKWANMSDEDRKTIGNNISKGKKGKIAITDTIKTYYISPEKWCEYEQKGFYKMSLNAYRKLNNIKTS